MYFGKVLTGRLRRLWIIPRIQGQGVWLLSTIFKRITTLPNHAQPILLSQVGLSHDTPLLSQWTVVKCCFLPSDAQGEGRGLRPEGRHVAPNEVRACHMTSHLPGSVYAHRPHSLKVQTRFQRRFHLQNKPFLSIADHKEWCVRALNRFHQVFAYSVE